MEFIDLNHIREELNPPTFNSGTAAMSYLFKKTYRVSIHKQFGGKTFIVADKVLKSKLLVSLFTLVTDSTSTVS
jgi:hypothetical protein